MVPLAVDFGFTLPEEVVEAPEAGVFISNDY
jgi:hypothetical protein